MGQHTRLFVYTFLCMMVVMTPIIAFVLAGFFVGAPLLGNEEAYLAAAPGALLYALLISIPLSLCAGCCAASGLHDIIT